MKNILFSVIIPTYNRANYLDRCLKSLQSQTCKDFEVLVCDDGSTDNTEDIVKKYNSILTIQYIKDENFGGPARPRNNGIKKANGNFIAFLDSDDWWYPNKLEISLRYMEGFDLIHHKLDIYTNLKKTNKVARGRVLSGDNVKDLIINGNGIVNSSVIIRKSIVALVGAITEDKNLIAVEDYDYWIRVAKITDRFKYIDQSLGGYWVGENISDSLKQIERRRCILDKYSETLSDDEQKKSLFIYYYLGARIYHSNLLFHEAMSFYIKSFDFNNVNFFFKSIIGYLLCFLKIKK